MTDNRAPILLVEDEAAHAELVRRAFETHGAEFRLCVAERLEEALALLEQPIPFALIIADWRLPDGDGLALLSSPAVRQHIPLMLMTSYGHTQGAVDAIKAGALDYVVKSEVTLLDMPHIARRAIREWKVLHERAQIEAALHISEERLRLALEAAQMGIWDCTLADGAMILSQQAMQIFGLAPGTFAGTYAAYLDLIHPADRAAVADAVGEVMADRRLDFHVEHRITCADGSLRWLECRGRVYHDAGGAPVRMAGTVTDITARRLAEAESKQLEAQLYQAQKLEAIGRLAGGIAHDFNNILTVVIGTCDIILHDREQSPLLRHDIEQIQHVATRAAALTRQLLVFGRKQIVQPQTLNLNAIVENTRRLVVPLIGEDVELVTRLHPRLGAVRADPGQLELALMNLVINARDAMPDGGALTIETANAELDERHARQRAAIAPGRYVLLTVSDTGCGMDAATQARIFEPFFTTKQPGKGTGLGLAIVHGIVNQSDGHIEVDSEPGRGTVFRIYLPRVEEPPEPVAPGPPASQVPRDTGTILLVEDEALVRALASRVLRNSGYHVLEAESGPAALRLAESYEAPIDMLLTDIVMPGGVNGRQLAEQLRARHPRLRVLYMSGYSGMTAPSDEPGDSAHAFLQKPFTPRALIHKVWGVLHPQQPRQDA